MTNYSFPTDARTALNVLCLYLAQPGHPHTDLGFDTQDAAFGNIGEIFGLSKNSVKNERDRYDRFTDSNRVGWKEEALPPRLQEVFDQFSTIERDELLRLSTQILSMDWGVQMPAGQIKNVLFERVVGEVGAPTQVRAPSDGITVEFSNTGRRSNGWFLLTVEQILKAFDDLIDNHDVIVAEVGSEASYEEAVWRRLFEEHLSDDVAKTMGKVQTLPLFELLSKIIHFAENDAERVARTLNLDLTSLNIARTALHGWWAASQSKEISHQSSTALSGGENVIFYGAPGTGKSHRVEELVKVAGKDPIRTVFHPDLQNSDFFGCLKPRMVGDDVRYEFAPGPFMSALAEAHESPDKPVYLVIEELNRAAAAAVFGDLFLLLDRDDDGAGEYSVSFSSPESRLWFEEKTGVVQTRMKLPSNLFIYATMNSADQGVYPIDTAFRRRWRQEYLPLDYKSGPDGLVVYADAESKQRTMEWRDFVKTLNDYLVSNHSLAIAEDRLLGQWFVKKKELEGTSIPEKVLLYLWDDLLRHEGRDQIFDTGTITTYGALDKASKEGKRFLSGGFLEELNTVSKPNSEVVGENEAG